MLCISRRQFERVVIGDVVVMIARIGRESVRLSIEAPRSVPIYREGPQGEPQGFNPEPIACIDQDAFRAALATV